MSKLRGISLFASAGIAEMNLKKCGIDILLANELLEKRAETHKFWHPNAEMICGSITDEEIKEKLIQKAIEYFTAWKHFRKGIKILIELMPYFCMKRTDKDFE